MRYKLSNIATKKRLEKFANAKFRFPKIYKVKPVYTGLEEELVPIITQENKNQIDFGIWGILPENYEEDWSEFQNIISTLTIVYHEINFNHLLTTKSKRCVVLVTGFFSSFLKNGNIYPNYVYEKHKSPFFLAAYYNTLNDGFLTVTIALKNKEPQFDEILNLSKFIPKVLDEDEKNTWLSDTATTSQLDAIMQDESKVDLQSHPIAKELFKMNIFYESMLQPVHYEP